MRWGIVAIAVGAVIAAPVIWYQTARPLALIMQGEPDSGAPLKKIGWNGTYLTIEGRIFTADVLVGSYELKDLQDARFSVDAQRQLVATVKGRSLVLGPADGTVSNGGEAQPAFAPAPGDRITFGRAEGWYAWPNWFEMNFMTGQTAQWKRFITYKLTWKKASGATLTLIWRYERYYYPQNGWVDADMTGDGCGLVGATIAPAP